MIKQIKAALAVVARAGLNALQAGPRSTQGNQLNYASVNTLDPARLASAFAAADIGQITEQAKLFELVEEQDAHIFSELAKRRRAVTGLGWKISPLKDAPQAELDHCGELADMLRAIPRFEDAQYDLTDAIGKGFAALEIDWMTGSTWLPRALNWLPQREFLTDRDTATLLLNKQGIGEPLREWGWVVHEHRSKSGYLEQAALFRVLAWTYAYKAYNTRDMQKFLELYGLPIVLGKYPAGGAKDQRDTLLRAVKNLGNDARGVIPSNMAVEFVQMTGGKVVDFLDAIRYWENKQSMSILGGTLTSQADGKSSTNALGLIHDKVRREIMLHDVRQIEPTITQQLIKPICLLNGLFAPDRLPRFEYLTQESVDQAKMVDVLDRAAGMGMQIGVNYAHEILQIPQAAESDVCLTFSGKTTKTMPKEDAALRSYVALAKARLAADKSSDVVDAYSARLAALCVPHEQALIDEIGRIVAQSSDFDEAIARVEALRANDPGFAETIALGLAAAHMAGRGAA